MIDVLTTTQGAPADRSGPPTAREVAREIRALGRATTTELARRLSDLTGRPTKTRNRPVLIRAVARGIAAAAPALPGPAFNCALRAALAPPTTPRAPFRHDPRVPPIGSVLRHGTGDDAVEIQVTRTGFLWRGRAHDSLSGIALEATGTSWNGYLFFGITKRTRRPPPWRAR